MNDVTSCLQVYPITLSQTGYFHRVCRQSLDESRTHMLTHLWSLCILQTARRCLPRHMKHIIWCTSIPWLFKLSNFCLVASLKLPDGGSVLAVTFQMCASFVVCTCLILLPFFLLFIPLRGYLGMKIVSVLCPAEPTLRGKRHRIDTVILRCKVKI